MSKMIKCKICGGNISLSTKICPSCGGKVKLFHKRWWFIFIVVIIIIVGLIYAY